mmetsp:Transcript_6975/g.9526  ORF Transcript_6975/g.9526 Transcript_6975/m.9526 type:complete len:169 (-) Transcript_6975:40-546(-)
MNPAPAFHMSDTSVQTNQASFEEPLEETLSAQASQQHAEDAEWEHCDVSSVGGSSWIEIPTEMLHGSEEDDLQSECSDMSFLVVGDAPEQPTEENQGRTWAQRLASQPKSQSQPQQHSLQQRQVPPRLQPKRAKEVKVITDDNDDCINGFGMSEDIVMTRRHPKSKRR